mmetsp:Transcript_51171/g.170800  ORF Transcript_51171/g.170800 Transcript_51171/m.170800 type:complete len:249 (-) Transcript_51171:639-1385(-)
MEACGEVRSVVGRLLLCLEAEGELVLGAERIEDLLRHAAAAYRAQGGVHHLERLAPVRQPARRQVEVDDEQRVGRLPLHARRHALDPPPPHERRPQRAGRLAAEQARDEPERAVAVLGLDRRERPHHAEQLERPHRPDEERGGRHGEERRRRRHRGRRRRRCGARGGRVRAGHSREEVGGVGLQRVEVLGADDGESHLFREVVVPVPAEQLAVHAGLVERLQRAGPEVVERVAGWREGAAELPEAPGV